MREAPAHGAWHTAALNQKAELPGCGQRALVSVGWSLPSLPLAAGGSFSWATALALEGPEEQGREGGPPVGGAGSRLLLPVSKWLLSTPGGSSQVTLGPLREPFELGEAEAHPGTLHWPGFQSSSRGARV